MFPSGSLNQAIFAPEGADHTPSSSCGRLGNSLKANAAGGQFPNARVNVRNAPAQRGVLCGLELVDFLDAKHGSIVVEDDGEWIVADERKAEGVAIKTSARSQDFAWRQTR